MRGWQLDSSVIWISPCAKRQGCKPLLHLTPEITHATTLNQSRSRSRLDNQVRLSMIPEYNGNLLYIEIDSTGGTYLAVNSTFFLRYRPKEGYPAHGICSRYVVHNMRQQCEELHIVKRACHVRRIRPNFTMVT